ncbi:MAG TPA: hypothetical protein DHW22_11990 [Planctomycetaceae bacterium]|nr:hypothetical protein [Planctomycetaceae bacterium]
MNMRCKVLAGCLVIVLSWDCTLSCLANESVASSSQQAELIQRLIGELGHEDYLIRRRAEAQLIDFGADAFDDLQAAELNSDLEIATRAKYILYLIRVQWVHPEDPSDIRKLMKGYGEFSVASRRDRISQLAALEKDLGLGALCRIARYDASPILSRQAAVAILGGKVKHSHRISNVRETILDEIGDAESIPVQWLRMYLDQLQRPEFVNPKWLPLIDAELQLIQQEVEDEDFQLSTILEFLRFHLQLGVQANDSKSVFETLRRRIDLRDQTFDDSTNSIINAIEWTDYEKLIYILYRQGGTSQIALAFGAVWAIEHQQWKVLDNLESYYQQEFETDRLMLYLSAIARGQQGRIQEAEEFASRGFEIVLKEVQLYNDFASLMSELGRHDWAEREWKHVIEEDPATSSASMSARFSYASLRLHDRGEDIAAAELLTETLDAIEASADIKRRLLRDPGDRELIKSMRTQRAFFMACHSEAQGDYKAQRKYLDRAAMYTMEDPDVLISKYHLQGANDTYRKGVQSQIKTVCKKLEDSIKKNPNDISSLNHWAWLVSNTEGDFQKAIKFSHRSLELAPGRASFLDTLGRCYFAAGDLENALRYQRQAVKLHPHMQVMHRQLALFEKEFTREKN